MGGRLSKVKRYAGITVAEVTHAFHDRRNPAVLVDF